MKPAIAITLGAAALIVALLTARSCDGNGPVHQIGNMIVGGCRQASPAP